MTMRLVTAALSAIVAMVAVTLQGCGVASVAGQGTAKAIQYYCSTDAGKIMKLLEVEKSRKVNAMCNKFKNAMSAEADHSVETSSGGELGVDAKLEIYCYGQAAEVWEQETLKAIDEAETECVANLTKQAKDISAAHVGEWSTKFNTLVTESYDMMHGAQSSVMTKFEKGLDKTLEAVDHTAAGVTAVTEGLTAAVGSIVGDVCHWVNDDYLGKIELAFNSTIANACDAAKQFAGVKEHNTDTNMGIDISLAIQYEQDCVEHNAADAAESLAKQTEELTQECKTYITDHLKGDKASITDLTKLAHEYIESKRPEIAVIEEGFNAEVTTLLQMQTEYEATLDAGETTRLFSLTHALPASAMGNGVAAMAVVGAGVAVMAALLAVAIRRTRGHSSQEGTSGVSMVLTGYDQDLLESGAEEQ